MDRESVCIAEELAMAQRMANMDGESRTWSDSRSGLGEADREEQGDSWEDNSGVEDIVAIGTGSRSQSWTSLMWTWSACRYEEGRENGAMGRAMKCAKETGTRDEEGEYALGYRCGKVGQ